MILRHNEQRFAANLKTVVATGDLSEHADSNIGQFLKYIPGVSGTSAIEVRGFPSEYTKITVDGGSIADAQLGGNSRNFETHYSMTSDNVARVEVISSANYTTAAAIVDKSAIAFNADYRLTKNSVVSAFVQTCDGQNNINISYVLNHSTGTDNRPLVAGTGANSSYAQDYTIGALGRGTVQFTNNFADTRRGGVRGNVRYAYDNGDWKVDAHIGESTARTWLRNPEQGIVNRMVASNAIPVRVEFHDIDSVFGPGEVRVYNDQNQLLDVHDKSFHNFTRVESVTVNGRDVRDAVDNFKLDIRKKLNFLPVPLAVQIGGERRDQFRSRTGKSEVYNYNGVNGNFSPLPYVADNPPLVMDPDGRSAPTLSPYAAVKAWKANPGLFTATPAQQVTAETFRIQNSEYIQETADSLYFQASTRLFNNRLNVLTGVRYETTTGKGKGALGVSGSF